MGQLILKTFLLLIHVSAGSHQKSVFGCTSVRILFKCLIDYHLYCNLEKLSKNYIGLNSVEIYIQFLERKRQ